VALQRVEVDAAGADLVGDRLALVGFGLGLLLAVDLRGQAVEVRLAELVLNRCSARVLTSSLGVIAMTRPMPSQIEVLEEDLLEDVAVGDVQPRHPSRGDVAPVRVDHARPTTPWR
jgi:hypothetical protein